jgi:mRNA interferase RelE/StbE
MSYEVLILPRAVKEIARLPASAQTRIRISLGQLGQRPRGPGCKKLTGRDGFRTRVGDYRIVYEVSDDDRTVTILHVGHRRDVYR